VFCPSASEICLLSNDGPQVPKYFSRNQANWKEDFKSWVDHFGGFLPSLPPLYTSRESAIWFLQARLIEPFLRQSKTWRPLLALHTSKPNVYQKAYFIFECWVDFRVLIIGLVMYLLCTKDKIFGASCLEWEIHWMGSMLTLHRTILWLTRPPKCSESPHNC
jgi:hypothetical protein